MQRTLQFIFGVLLSLLTGCATAYTPSPDRTFEAIPEFTCRQAVALVNAQPDAQAVSIGGGMLADYRAWTEVAIAIAARELQKRGATVDAKAPTTLQLAVTRADYDVGWVTLTAEVDLRVELPGGYSRTYTGKNAAAMAASPRHLIDGAMMRAVVELLKDPRIVAYVAP